MERKLSVETLSELQIWIEGQFALVKQAQETAHNDLTTIRAKVHELSNDLAKLIALNVPDKLSKHEELHIEHKAAIDGFKADLAARRGALAAFKIMYVVSGAIAGGFVTMALEFYRLFPNG